MLGRLGILLVTLSFGLAPANALANSSQDASSTHTTLVAASKTLHSVLASWPALEANLHNLDKRFAGECPNVGAGSPQNEPEQRLSYEVAGALWATAYHTDAKYTNAFIKIVSPLRWSNPAIARTAHKFIQGLREMTALEVPNLCADVRSWTATGYQTIPASTLRFDTHVENINVELPSPHLVAAYVTPADRGLYANVEHLIRRFEELEFTTGQKQWDSLLETLGLQQ